MYEEQVKYYKPPFQQAYRDVCHGLSGGVFRHRDMQLARTADFGPWEPHEDVLHYIPNIKNITIQMICETTNLEEMMITFRRERNIGLVLIGREISRKDKASLIVLTTSDIYYVIDPNNSEQGTRLLKMTLQCSDLTTWTTNGLFEADCLYHNYGIKLHGTNAKCCLGLHLHLMKVISCLPRKVLIAPEGAVSMYPERALFLARQRNFALVSFKSLIQTWLQINDIGHFEFNYNQFVHLETRPLNETAINIIRRRCCLVLKLAAALEFYVVSELSTMNRNALECLTHCNEATSKLVRDVMNKDEKRKVISAVYHAHLDNGGENLEGSIHKTL